MGHSETRTALQKLTDVWRFLVLPTQLFNDMQISSLTWPVCIRPFSFFLFVWGFFGDIFSLVPFSSQRHGFTLSSSILGHDVVWCRIQLLITLCSSSCPIIEAMRQLQTTAVVSLLWDFTVLIDFLLPIPSVVFIFSTTHYFKRPGV